MNKKKTKLRGISYHTPSKSWVARISKDGVDFPLGYYTTEWEAAIAYDAASEVLHPGEVTNEARGFMRDMPYISEEERFALVDRALSKLETKLKLIHS
jgi:hypothetical protein